MNHNRKGLLVALAILVVAATPVSTAQAEGKKGKFTAAFATSFTEPATVHGVQKKELTENYFETVGGERISCDETTLTGTLKDADVQLTITPHYEFCQAKIGASTFPVTAFENGCDFLFTQPTTVQPLDTGLYTGKIDLTCPANSALEFKAFTSGNSTLKSHSAVVVCTVKIFPGNLAGHALYQVGQFFVTPEVAADGVFMGAGLENISWTKSGVCGHSSGNQAVYLTYSLLTALNDPAGGEHNEHLDFFISD